MSGWEIPDQRGRGGLEKGREDLYRTDRRGSGDQVKITEEESLEINGSVVAESNIFYKTPAYEGAVAYPLTLSSGEYFVLGDFREGAKDSRYFGPIERKEIKGKVLVVLRRKEI